MMPLYMYSVKIRWQEYPSRFLQKQQEAEYTGVVAARSEADALTEIQRVYENVHPNRSVLVERGARVRRVPARVMVAVLDADEPVVCETDGGIVQPTS